MRPLRLGMLGLGHSHPFTYTKLLEEGAVRPAPGKPDGWRAASITHIWDYDAEKTRAFAAEHGATALDSPEALLAGGPDGQVDGVLVLTRNGDHAVHALPFLRAGVPTFIDKPICTTPEDLQALLAAARQHQTPLYSCSSARYDAIVPALKDLIAGGELGTLLAVRASVSHSIARYMEEPHRWQDDVRMGGGTIVNMGIHGMEPLVAVLGPDVASVTCVAEKRQFKESLSEDTALATFRWRGGVLATLEVYSGSAAGGRSFAACGSGGIVELIDGELRWVGGKRQPLALPSLPRGYVLQLESFIDMIRTREEPIPLAETAAVATGLFAARRAADERREVQISSFE